MTTEQTDKINEKSNQGYPFEIRVGKALTDNPNRPRKHLYDLLGGQTFRPIRFCSLSNRVQQVIVEKGQRENKETYHQRSDS